jgi:hypothetical protein
MKIYNIFRLFILQILCFSIWTFIDAIMDLYKWTDKKRMQVSSIFILILIIIIFNIY